MPALYDDEAMGKFGFKRVTSGTASPSKGKFVAVKAISGPVTFGPGCQVPHGDPPADGDVLSQGDIITAQFDQVDVKDGGALYCFYEKEQ